MSDIAETVLSLLQKPSDAAAWAAVLAPDATHEILGGTIEGRDAVAARLGNDLFAQLDWERLDKPGKIVFAGRARPGGTGRSLALTIEGKDGLVTRFCQQMLTPPPSSGGTPMVMSDALRERIDTALAEKHAMYMAYVDKEGRPHLSMRGSILTLGPDSLGLWARAGGGMPEAVADNPNVALFYRDEVARAMYQITGRARIAEDEATRRRIYDAMPVVEQRHDFAEIGTAIVVDLDLVTGWAGFSATGQIDPVRLVRGA
ncbi:pyridoxamine 5'-phosphate oxidase family protein [Sphingobium nicotianae]|uniref:Pyridoxamine 5'-phosphate oxidase family protein n=1 Tax=Sphingobium nicotianae TaxID=2782607 RepID=A0A9X1DB34_9SPHN|nr:pyridoxamine 5'-phosphate oxidase family protein [Sphingobium nicotianae]MBT2186650.1 pyridoxamine 5'-phosphate oxidase family protein [Sphingobium nicotianae]